jgi:hypothetical protein
VTHAPPLTSLRSPPGLLQYRIEINIERINGRIGAVGGIRGIGGAGVYEVPIASASEGCCSGICKGGATSPLHKLHNGVNSVYSCVKSEGDDSTA